MRNFLILIFISISLSVTAQLTLHVVSYPAESPDPLSIYVAGNFTGWDPGDPAYQLTDNLDGTFSITITPAAGLLEFKFTRGDWATVEGNAFGGYLPNRTFNYTGGEAELEIDILTWEDLGPGWSTAAENVFILDEDFYMPQLDRYRRIWMYLPPDYDVSTNDYKVLYMHDGQNVFDLATSFAGEWEVDETLNTLFDEGDEGCIVVAIDNGGGERLNEYSPWAIPLYGVEGLGEYYIDFIVETLKPYIDANYRTKPEREFTGIMGSSMGGLISTYAGVEHRETFSRVGSFSPAYWITDSCYIHVEETAHDAAMRIYSIGGELEGISMTAGLEEMDNALQSAGYTSDEYLTVIHPDGQHSEWYWAREFKDAYLWMWDQSATAIQQQDDLEINIYADPVHDKIFIQNNSGKQIGEVKVYDMQGRLQLHIAEATTSVDISRLIAGNYILQIMVDNTFVVKHFSCQ